MKALHDIPNILNNARWVLRVFRDSERLNRIIKAGFKGPSFEEDLTSDIQDIVKYVASFNREVDVCQKEMLEKIKSSTLAIHGGTSLTSRGSATSFVC